VTIHGPADADHYRVQVGRYGERWYTDPLPACDIADATEWTGPSISTVKKASGSDWTYVGLKRVAAQDADELTNMASLDPGQRYDRLKGYNAHGLKVAAGRGTIVHWWAEDLLNGLTPRHFTPEMAVANGVPAASAEEADHYWDALHGFFDAYQPELVATESVCIHRMLNGGGYGGTADAIVRLNNGMTVMLDWKSRGADSKHSAHPEEAGQVSALAGAEYMIVQGDNGAAQRIPVTAVDCGLIVSIRPDGFRCYPIDLEAGFAHWTSMHAWWLARRNERQPIGRQWAPKAPKENQCDTSNSTSATASGSTDVSRPTSSTNSDGDNTARGTSTDTRPEAPTVTPKGTATVTPRDSPTEATPARRDALLAKYRRLTDEQQRRFVALNIPADDLDAIERALHDIDPFSQVTEPVKPERAPVEHQPTLNEGATASVEARQALATAHAMLEPSQAAWVKSIVARVGNLSVTQVPSERRVCIGTALVQLACAGWGDDVLEACMDLAATDPHIEHLAHWGVGAASALADIANMLAAGELEISRNDGGDMRLIAA
jgi:hypothetical protein